MVPTVIIERGHFNLLLGILIEEEQRYKKLATRNAQEYAKKLSLTISQLSELLESTNGDIAVVAAEILE